MSNEQTSRPPDVLMIFFGYRHLPDHLQETSRKFCELAEWVDSNLPSNTETSAAIRRILEAKDCAVRSRILKDNKS